MRILTYALLSCHSKKCASAQHETGSLALSDVETTEHPTQFNAGFLQSMLCRVPPSVLVSTCHALGVTLPESLLVDGTVVDAQSLSEEEMRLLHRVLLEVEIRNGRMTCEGCGHEYPIINGIPNMLLREDEV